jgi:hypothetical protein
MGKLTENAKAISAEQRNNVEYVFKKLLEEKPSLEIVKKRIANEQAYILKNQAKGFAAKQSTYHLEGLKKYQNFIWN